MISDEHEIDFLHSHKFHFEFVVYKYNDGAIYDGEMKNNLMNGHGTHRYPDGSVYEGEYKDDKKNGFGCFTYSDQSIYKGQWKDGRHHGQGLLKWSNWAEFDGSFLNGDMSTGTLLLADGIAYMATFTRLDRDDGGVSFYSVTLVNLQGGVSPIIGFFANGYFSPDEQALRNSQSPKSPAFPTSTAALSSSSPQKKHRRTAMSTAKR